MAINFCYLFCWLLFRKTFVFSFHLITLSFGDVGVVLWWRGWWRLVSPGSHLVSSSSWWSQRLSAYSLYSGAKCKWNAKKTKLNRFCLRIKKDYKGWFLRWQEGTGCHLYFIIFVMNGKTRKSYFIRILS